MQCKRVIRSYYHFQAHTNRVRFSGAIPPLKVCKTRRFLSRYFCSVLYFLLATGYFCHPSFPEPAIFLAIYD